MVLEQLLQRGKNLMTVFLFPLAFHPRPPNSILLSSLLPPWICPGDSRVEGGQEVGWHPPALLPIDSCALIRKSCIQKRCANQDLLWICKSQVQLIAKAFKKQNSLLTWGLIKCDMPFPVKISLENSEVKSPVWLLSCQSFWSCISKSQRQTRGFTLKLSKIMALNNPRAVLSLHNFVLARKWYFLFTWWNVWHCNWSLVFQALNSF